MPLLDTPPLSPHGIEPLISERQLCDLLGIGLPTIACWRAAGKGPRFIVLGVRRLAYRPSDVRAWQAARERTAGSARWTRPSNFGASWTGQHGSLLKDRTMTTNTGDALDKMLADLLGPPEDQGLTAKAANSNVPIAKTCGIGSGSKRPKTVTSPSNGSSAPPIVRPARKGGTYRPNDALAMLNAEFFIANVHGVSPDRADRRRYDQVHLYSRLQNEARECVRGICPREEGESRKLLARA
jgi:predicted DNA-binding transcriptional regulator AlpA